MENNREHTNKSITRQFISAGAGIVVGSCAGSTAMHVVTALAVSTISNPSAMTKVIVGIGRWGIGIATAMKVAKTTEDIMENLFACSDAVKLVAGSIKTANDIVDNMTNDQPIQAEGEVEDNSNE